jgi:hypothetical protein
VFGDLKAGKKEYLRILKDTLAGLASFWLALLGVFPCFWGPCGRLKQRPWEKTRAL